MSIVHVAKAAGVSTATVSRVMNELPGVRSETVALVRAAIEELNYKPRRSGPTTADAGKIRRRRRSRTSAQSPSIAGDVGLRTGNIAVVTVGHTPDWLQRPVLAEALGGVQRGVSELGLRLILEEMRDPATATQLMIDRQIDGAILFLSSDASQAGEQIFSTIRKHVPAVWVMGTSVANSTIDHVTTDNVAIGQLAATHLFERGCRRLGFFSAHPEWALSRLRGQTYINRAADDGIEAAAYLESTDAKVIRGYGHNVFSGDSLEIIVDRIVADVRGGDGPMGLFVCVDYELAWLHPLLVRRGIVIDRDLHLLSCDNESARLAAMQPRPLSIDTGAGEIGFRAVVRLLARIQRPDDRPLTIMVAPRVG